MGFFRDLLGGCLLLQSERNVSKKTDRKAASRRSSKIFMPADTTLSIVATVDRMPQASTIVQDLPLQVQDLSVEAVISSKAEPAPAHTNGAAAQQPARELLQNLPDQGRELECLNMQSLERPTLEEEVGDSMSAIQKELECKTLQICTAERAAEDSSRELVKQMVVLAFAKTVHTAELEDVKRRALAEKTSLLEQLNQRDSIISDFQHQLTQKTNLLEQYKERAQQKVRAIMAENNQLHAKEKQLQATCEAFKNLNEELTTSRGNLREALQEAQLDMDTRLELISRLVQGATVVVGEKLGSGGQGAVYKATVTFHAVIKIANKDPDTDEIDEDAEEELQEEADTHMAIPSHPNILGVLGCTEVVFKGEARNGLLLELGSGSLDQYLGPEPLHRDHVVYFIHAMVSGVAHMHAAGMVHRDIKPGNLMVDSIGVLKIADFGCAFSMSNPVGFSWRGTHSYISPATLMCAQEGGPYDDVRAIAATAFQLITGESLDIALLRPWRRLRRSVRHFIREQIRAQEQYDEEGEFGACLAMAEHRGLIRLEEVVPQKSLSGLPKELLHCVLRGISSPETLDLSDFLASSALAMDASGHGSIVSLEEDSRGDSSDGKNSEGGASDEEDPEAETIGAVEDCSSDSGSDGGTVRGRPIGLRTWVAMKAAKEQRNAAAGAMQVHDDAVDTSCRISSHISATCCC